MCADDADELGVVGGIDRPVSDEHPKRVKPATSAIGATFMAGPFTI
jgi:hypothetical protein